MTKKSEPDWPKRGVPNGWRDSWDGPDEAAEVREQMEAAERRATDRALLLGATNRREESANREDTEVMPP